MADETTTDRLAEIEGQAADYPPPEGWRWLQIGEVIRTGDRWVRLVDGQLFDAYPNGQCVRHRRFIRRIEPEPEPEQPAADYTPPEGWRKLQVGEAIHPGDAWHYPQADVFETDLIVSGVATSDGHYLRRIEQPENTITADDATGLVGRQLIRGLVLQVAEAIEATEQPEPEPQAEPQPEPQPVQVREGRWRTRNGEIRHVTPTPEARKTVFNQSRYSWYDAQYNQTWLPNGHYHLGGDSLFDLLEYLGPIEPEPEKIITPDDVAAEALAVVWDQAKAEQQIAELRDEVSHVQGLLGEEKLRNVRLETLVTDLRAVNAATEKAVNSAARDKADLQHRLDTVAAEWALQAGQISGLQQQLEAVKAELVQVSKDRQALQIELDAREQVPQAIDDRFEQGWDKGTARAVETIAEWLEPIKAAIDAADNQDELARSGFFAIDTIRHLPHIMRSLTGLTDED